MSNRSICVRHATTEDLSRMMAIASRAITAGQWGPRQYQEAFSSGRLALVVEEHNQVVGFIIGHGAGGEWEIENIAVAAPSRRHGLGSRLLREFLHQVRSSGGNRVFLEVRESNRTARAFYDKWAFVEVGKRKDYYLEPREDALVLRFYFPAEP